ncbi:MAG: hypothetical protein Q9174_001076 [Haloplaca sp. 1 TL-2023]
MTTSPAADHNSPPSKSPTFRFKRKRSDDISAYDSSKRRVYSPSVPHHHHRCHRHRTHDHRSRNHGVHSHHSKHRRPTVSPPLAPELDPDTAFRESLFDALADDEGADYWESVYGQPIHIYPPSLHTHHNNSQQGELQRMTDDEYSTYVRARMWEKSHGYIREERHRREKEGAQRRKQEKHERDLERDVEEALRRGEQRRAMNRWKDAWARYLKDWEVVLAQKNGQDSEFERYIPWPVATGRYDDVQEEEVGNFFKHAPKAKALGDDIDLGQVLKAERVRWHPDKFIQRAGNQGLNDRTITKVTAVFQIIDKLWSNIRRT